MTVVCRAPVAASARKVLHHERIAANGIEDIAPELAKMMSIMTCPAVQCHCVEISSGA